MSAIAAAVKHMLAAGMEHASIVAAVEEMEASATSRGGDAAERRRAWDRERKRKARASAKSGGNPVEYGGNPHSPVDTSDGPRAPSRSNINPPSEDVKNPPTGGKKIADAIHPLPINEAFDAWNAMAAKAGLQTVRDHSSKRIRALQARLKDAGMAGWLEVMALVAGSQFLTGRNDRQWRASFDFVVKAENFTKIREGSYAKPGDRKVSATAGYRTLSEAEWAKALQTARDTNKWWIDDLGPMPGDTGCRVPEHLITDSDRRQNFVTRRSA